MRIGWISNEPMDVRQVGLHQSCNMTQEFAEMLCSKGHDIMWLNGREPGVNWVKDYSAVAQLIKPYFRVKWQEKYEEVRGEKKWTEFFIENWKAIMQFEDSLFASDEDPMPELDIMFMDYVDVGGSYDVWQWFLLYYYTLIKPCKIFILDDDLKLYRYNYGLQPSKHKWGRLAGIFGKLGCDEAIVQNSTLLVPSLDVQEFEGSKHMKVRTWQWWMSPNDERPVNMQSTNDIIYGGADYDRRVMFEKYYGKMSTEYPDIKIHIVGNWEDYPKDKFPNIDWQPQVVKSELRDKLYRHMAVMHLAPARYAKIGMYTPRIFECTAMGLIVFVPSDIHGIDKLMPEWNIVSSHHELYNKMQELKNTPLLRYSKLHDQKEALSKHTMQNNYQLILDLCRT